MAARTVQKRSCDRDRLQLKAELRKEVGSEQRAVSRAHAHITAYTVHHHAERGAAHRVPPEHRVQHGGGGAAEGGGRGVAAALRAPHPARPPRAQCCAREGEDRGQCGGAARGSSSLFFLYFIFRLQTRFSHISEHSEFFEFLSYNSHFHFHCQTVWSASAQRWWPRGGGWRCRCNSGGIGSSAARRCPLRGRGRGRFAWESACGAIAGSVTPCLLSAPP